MSRRVSRVRSSCSSWLMASGMESSHRGFAGTVQLLTAGRRTGRLGGGVNGFARIDVGQDVDPPPDAPLAPRGRLCVRLDVGAGSSGLEASWVCVAPPAPNDPS